jgi:hypothetical protein
VDTNRFDRLTRVVFHHVSRRDVLRGLGAAIAAIVTAALGREQTEARASSVPLGGACYHSRQCRNQYVPTQRRQINPDLQIVHCADNGFVYDGPYNCCRYTGGACHVDEHCCGTRRCVKQFCRYVKGKRRARRQLRHPR